MLEREGEKTLEGFRRNAKHFQEGKRQTTNKNIKTKEVLKFTRNPLESESEDIQVSIINQLLSKQWAFTSEFSARRIRVEFDGTVFDLAEELGRLVVTESTAGMSSLPVLAHKSGMTPVVMVGGKESSEEGMFNSPYGVAVDYQTGNIYVSDCAYSYWRIQVFDSIGEYLYEITNGMNSPYSLAISENRLFVCQFNTGCVIVYDLNGTPSNR